MGIDTVPRGRRRLNLLTACILMALLCLATGQPIFSFGESSAQAQPAAEQPAEQPADHAAQDDHADETAADTAHAEVAHADAAHGEDHGGHGGGHSDPVAPVLLWLVIILVGAKIGGDIFDRLGQPAVLGELLAGVLLGNLVFFVGIDVLWVLREGSTIFSAVEAMSRGLDPAVALQAAFPTEPETVARFLAMAADGSLVPTVEMARTIDIFSRVGVIILLFMVGLESSLQDMLKVGVTSFIVAIVGVVAPFGLGYVVSMVLLPEHSVYVHLFIGATLCATSVGITARVFKDLKKLHTREAKIILGAAVIDDVLGLIILAVVQGIILAAGAPAGAGDSHLAMDVLKIIGLSVLFLGGALVLGVKLTPYATKAVAKMRVPGMKLIFSLVLAFLLSWAADAVGLASIVGAFAAGLVLDDVYFKDFSGANHRLEELIEPIAVFLVPVFFVQMGMQVKLETFANVSILGLAAGLTVAAVIGKQVCGLAVRDKTISRTSIGFGMIPRGEVGLIFAAIGKGLSIRGESVVDAGTFSAVVIMVILTTLATPPLLKMSLAKKYPDGAPGGGGAGGSGELPATAGHH